MTITLRQESQAGTTTKGSTLTYAELDNNFIDLLTNKILPLQIDAETGSVKVGQAQSNGVFNITGSTGVSTAVTEDSTGNANLTISLDQVSGSNLNVTIYAKATESLSAGDVVMFAGVQGDHLQVKKAVIDDSAGDFISDYIVGMVETPLNTNDFGYIVTQGQITHSTLNTNSYAPGTILWYDPTTAGGWTATEPTAPNPKVRIAAVLKQNATDGILLVRPTFSRRIKDAEDVDTAAAANNDYLVYNSATSVWQHQALDISTDTTPTLGGDLAVNGNAITGSTVSINGSTGELMITATENGGVAIYYDNNLKFTTKSDGVDITGELQADSLDIDGNADITGTINTHTIPGGTGTFALTSDIIDTQIVGGDNITITQPDSAGEFTVAFSNPLNQPVVGGDQTLSQINLKDYSETVYQLSYAATITPDVANGNVQEITLTGAVAFGGFNSVANGQSLTLIIHQDGTGNRTFSESLDSANRMLFAGGTSTLSTAGGATDIMTIFYAGGTYYASLSTNFS